MKMLRDYLFYRFKVDYIATHNIRECFDEVVHVDKVPTTAIFSVIAPKYDGEEIAKMFVATRYKYSDLKNIELIDKHGIDGAAWLEGA